MREIKGNALINTLVGEEDRPIITPRLGLGRTAHGIENALLALGAIEQRIQHDRILAGVPRHLAHQRVLAGMCLRSRGVQPSTEQQHERSHRSDREGMETRYERGGHANLSLALARHRREPSTHIAQGLNDGNQCGAR